MPLNHEAVPKKKRFALLGIWGAVFILLLVLSGCAVTPTPFSEEQFQAMAREQRALLFEEQEPVSAQISLYEAMARAVKYNLEHRVKLLEKALASGTLDLARYELLPQLVASAGYSHRSNDSDSAGLSNGIESGNSISAEKRSFTANIITVWNILDFGVGYTRAQQQADQVLISEEWRRIALQNIVQDVRYAYWRAASAELLLPRMDQLLTRVEGALERARQMEESRVQQPAKTLLYQQQLLETVKQLWAMRKSLSTAKTELAALMNLDPGTDYRLGLDEEHLQYLERLLSIDALEEQALVQRSELRMEAYQKRISSLEVRKALLGMLPGLEFNVGGSFDDNKYLENQAWLHAGLNLSWNAFKLLSGPAAVKNGELQEELAQKRYLATAMMVLTQVNLAHQRYYLALKEYRIAEQLDAVHQRQLWHAAAAKKAQTGSELEEIRKLAAALSARMNRGVAYAELQGALGRIFHSTGMDPLPKVAQAHDISTLARGIGDYEQGVLLSFKATEEPQNKVVARADYMETYFAEQPPEPLRAEETEVLPPAVAEQVVSIPEKGGAVPEAKIGQVPSGPPGLAAMVGQDEAAAQAGPDETSGQVGEVEPDSVAVAAPPKPQPESAPVRAEKGEALVEEIIVAVPEPHRVGIKSVGRGLVVGRGIYGAREPSGLAYKVSGADSTENQAVD
ncbi:MAG: TolC family protein [Desulfobulbaceae bacterium]|nr:TolC family protein [Desulfobulbaceae bacterium]